MAINGIGNPAGVGGAGGYGPLAPRPRSPDLEVAKPVGSPASSRDEALATDHALPAEAPAGVDPALWSVLSSEERQYFNKVAAMGPLTYGPRSANVPPGMLRGGRIDRVV